MRSTHFSCREEDWKANGYKSANINLDSGGESEEEDEEDCEEDEIKSRDINYVVGDVTHPKHVHDRDAIVVHCAGMKKILSLCFNIVTYLSVLMI